MCALRILTCCADKKPYDRMNSLAANVVLNMTAGMRFEGSLNVDMNDISNNLVPFPKLHFLQSSLSPLSISKGSAAQRSGAAQHRAIDKMFQDVLSRQHQLMTCNPQHSMHLACGLLARGGVTSADVDRNMPALLSGMTMPYWNREVRSICMLCYPALTTGSAVGDFRCSATMHCAMQQHIAVP